VTGDSDKPAPGATVDEEMVRSLARLLDETRLTEIEIEQGGLRVRVARQAAPAPFTIATNRPLASPTKLIACSCDSAQA